MPALDLLNARPDAVAGQRAIDEHDEQQGARRHADDGTRQDAGQSERQDMVKHDLHLGCADAQRGHGNAHGEGSGNVGGGKGHGHN